MTVAEMKLKKYVYLHLSGCGGPAFTLDYLPTPGTTMQSDGVAHLDGRPIGFGENVTCDSCGEGMVPHTMHIISSRIYLEDQGAIKSKRSK